MSDAATSRLDPLKWGMRVGTRCRRCCRQQLLRRAIVAPYRVLALIVLAARRGLGCFDH